MLYTELLFSLPNNFLSSVRKLENVKKKLCKAEWSQHFNNVCLQENLMPNYTRMRYHDPALSYGLKINILINTCDGIMESI